MTPDDPHLISFFLYLKDKLRLPLVFEDYKLLQKAWAIEALRPKDYPELKKLCVQLWWKSKEKPEQIEQAFEEYLIPKSARETIEFITEKPASNPSTSSQSSQTELPSKTQPETIEPDLLTEEDIDSEVGVAVPQETTAERKTAQQEYIFNDEYFSPLTRAELAKGWSSLRQCLRTGKETELNIPATVKRICQENIAEFVCSRSRENQSELLLLIDQSNSMVPFSLIAERLVETTGHTFKSLKVFYFRNSPRNALFKDPELLDKHSLDEVLTQLHPTRTQVLIFSDGGATQSIPSEVRIELIENFLDSLQPTVRQIVWLNPLPKADWLGTSAQKISSLVPMFPFSILGWRELLRSLRGQTVTESNLEELPLDIKIDGESWAALNRVLETAIEKDQYEEVIETLSEFADDFPGYLNLAFHAAFPLAITPDLLYYLRDNFVELQDLPWIAVPDLLLSSLFQSIGGKLYQMDSGLRHLLLKALQIRFKNARLNQLSDALLFYLHQGLEESIADAEELGENPDWIALGYTQPTELAKQLAERLQKSFAGTNAEEKIKTASLTATLAEPLAEEGFQPLLKLARGVARQARGYEEGAQEIFRDLPPEIDIAGVKLKVPGGQKLPLKTFTFKTVTVNPKGKSNKPETKQAQHLTENIGKTPLEMVYIPGGTFTMGSPEGESEYDDEKPQHQVTIKPFLMGKYPVTQAQWEAVANLPKIQDGLDPNPSHFKGENRPVEQVSWYDTIEFCARLSRETGKNYRLPSEAEWEYACRAGTTTPFHFGETITTDLANYRGTDNEEYKWSGSYGQGPKGIYREETTPVGSFQVANAFGLYDMHGNVWEWCADPWHDSYEGAPKDGSVWDENNNDNHYQNYIDLLVNIKNDERRRLLRGGSWSNVPADCRAAVRFSFAPDDRLYDIGFRLVCSLAWTPSP